MEKDVSSGSFAAVGKRRLFLVTAAIVDGCKTEIFPGLLLALNADEASGMHARFVKDKMPGYPITMFDPFQVADDIVRAAYAELAQP